MPLAAATQAATITVDLASEALNPGGGCTLRGAVTAINNGINGNGCTATGTYGTSDTVNFSLGTATITLANIINNHIYISKSIVIDGSANNVTIDGNNANRIFKIGNGSTGTIKNLTLQNGTAASGIGGAISVETMGNYALIIQNCVFKDNQADIGGAIDFSGGMSTNSTLLVERSTFNGNSANGMGRGGAIWAYYATIRDSTFSGNSADNHGGAVWVGYDATISNSTFIGNTAVNSGGAIRTERTLTATHLTLVNNQAPTGAALYVYKGNSNTLKNSLIAGGASVTTAQCVIEPGAVLSSGTNLEWRNGADENSCGSIAPVAAAVASLTDIVDTVLANNGGPTQTLALPNNSPAVNAGDPAVPFLADQRGDPRPSPAGSLPDLGAFELLQVVPPSTSPIIIWPVTEAFVSENSSQTDIRSITGLIAPRPLDIGEEGAYFVFAYLPPSVAVAPDTIWYLDSALNWHLFTDCRITAAYYTGEIQILRGLPIIPLPADLSPFKGAQLYFGYGFGGYAAPSGYACNDMIARGYYKLVYTVD